VDCGHWGEGGGGGRRATHTTHKAQGSVSPIRSLPQAPTAVLPTRPGLLHVHASYHANRGANRGRAGVATVEHGADRHVPCVQQPLATLVAATCQQACPHPHTRPQDTTSPADAHKPIQNDPTKPPQVRDTGWPRGQRGMDDSALGLPPPQSKRHIHPPGGLGNHCRIPRRPAQRHPGTHPSHRAFCRTPWKPGNKWPHSQGKGG
jgi:hypothetical protein